MSGCTVAREANWKGNTLREFLRSCVEIMKDETALNTLYEILIIACKEGKLPCTKGGESGTT
jgi:hypothetical protein